MAEMHHAFAADCMLGKLARWLRILGFDTLYYHYILDEELIRVARKEERLILTRDNGIAAGTGREGTLLIRSVHLEEQLNQTVGELGLTIRRNNLLTRCLQCNNRLSSVSREEVAGQVPDFVFSTQQQFSRCENCAKIYWKSTHVSKILERLREMKIILS